ncbi:chemotaxis-specific protein-glutamate methyltransferase CheB [Roseomonas gilardii subsp. gilardii]|nr:chemotaxis-specific protein-glutamate methyltransferase CheB [Roseomonas gilardii]UPG74384.1 chemotaxis-specific protein-glutamate methyltransferase CheB [Roseomonas gilardii subsp. gilardii]
MLCDDSLTVRAAFSRILEADPGLRIVARAGDGRAALAAFAALPPAERPEVVLLDLEMPVMDGMTALPLLLRCEPRPSVIVASSLTQRGAAMAMAALRAGAVDYMPKPMAAAGGMADQAFRTELVEKVRGWARMRRNAPRPPALPPPPPQRARQEAQVLAIGSSTGGPQALAALLRGLRSPPPVPVLAVQHMPAGFPSMLADHLSRLGVLPVREARDGEVLRPGQLYLAPGDRHLLAVRDGGALLARLSDSPPENFCRPAVDPMLRSLVAACQGRVLAVILTGMGSDGLAGSRAVAATGGTVLAQDEASSVVWGMPGAVARAGLAEVLLPPEGLAERLRQQRWAPPPSGPAGVRT